jgi:hypothetical protein
MRYGLFGVFCVALLSLPAPNPLFAGGKGLPAYMAREYSGVSIGEVSDLAQIALEGRKFAIMDIDEDDDGDVIIETFRKPAFMMPAGNLIMRLRPTSDGWTKATIAFESGTSAHGKIYQLWDDLDKLVAESGGCATRQKRSGAKFVRCSGDVDWVPNSIHQRRIAQSTPSTTVDERLDAAPADDFTEEKTLASAGANEMFCIECGKEIPAIAKYCPHCGTRQSTGQ